MPNYFRKPYGPGWVLIGDAGYCKDPITAQGISDAFRDAEACAAALTTVFGGELSFDERDARATSRPVTRACLPMLRAHHPVGHTGAAADRDAADCSQRCRATRRRWTASSASSPARSSPVEFFDPAHIRTDLRRGSDGLVSRRAALPGRRLIVSRRHRRQLKDTARENLVGTAGSAFRQGD